jgi:hypothetical protein
MSEPAQSPSRLAGLDGPSDNPAGAEAERSYDKELESHLNSPTEPGSISGQADSDSDFDEDEFVYTGVDSAQADPDSGPPEPGSAEPSQTYKDQLAAFLNSDDDENTNDAVSAQPEAEQDAVGELARPVSGPSRPPYTRPHTTHSAYQSFTFTETNSGSRLKHSEKALLCCY